MTGPARGRRPAAKAVARGRDMREITQQALLHGAVGAALVAAFLLSLGAIN